MFTYQIVFTQKEENLKLTEQITDKVWMFLTCIFQKGLIYRDYQLIENENLLKCSITSSLDNISIEYLYFQYYNDRSDTTKKHLKKNELAKLFNTTLEKIGRSLMFEDICDCSKSQHFVLMTTYITVDSPIICGYCNKPVPLYKLPYIVEYDFTNNDILSWKHTYEAIDTIWMNCYNERFAYKQMSDPKSQISKSGIELCQKLEIAIGVPVYYYIYYYYKSKKTCPICGDNWKQENLVHFDYKCDKCRLVSRIVYYD